MKHVYFVFWYLSGRAQRGGRGRARPMAPKAPKPGKLEKYLFCKNTYFVKIPIL
jgi:hypothetical protein